MANTIPIVFDGTTQRQFDINNDELFINLIPTQPNSAVSKDYFDQYLGKVLLDNTDTTPDYLITKFDPSVFVISGSNNITLDNQSIIVDFLADNIDASTIGFNADMVDGYHASEFANLNDNQTFLGDITFQGHLYVDGDIEIRSTNYYNYANNVYFTTNLLALDVNQASNFPELSGLAIYRQNPDPNCYIVYDNSDGKFKVIDEDSNLLNFQVAEPVDDHDAATKYYVDVFIHDVENYYLRLDGSNSPSSNISWDNYRITDLGDPIDDNDAVNKKYVDTNHNEQIDSHSLQILRAITLDYWLGEYYKEYLYDASNRVIQIELWDSSSKNILYGRANYSNFDANNNPQTVDIFIDTYHYRQSITYNANGDVVSIEQVLV